MITKAALLEDLDRAGIDPHGMLLCHFSMKKIGPVENGADTVLDALMEYRKSGLLIVPWHTWSSVNDENVYGPRAQAFAEGQERFDTPCAPGSCYGELLRQNAQVMMVGVTFACNTSVHCIEEIANVPGRLTAEHHPLFVRDQSGRLLSVPSRRHQNANSDHYVKLEPVMFHRNILRRVPFGNAECLLFRGKDLLAVMLELLKKDPDLFGSGAPVPPEWY